MQNLALEVRSLDPVSIHKSQSAHPGSGQIESGG